MAEKKNQECDCKHEHHHDCDCQHEECDCGCDHEGDVVMLQDDKGNEVPFHYVYTMEHEGKEYVFLQAAEDEDEAIEIFGLETVEEDGEYYDLLDPVDDDLYDVLYEKLLLVASEDACEDDECDCHCHHDDCDCDHNE